VREPVDRVDGGEAHGRGTGDDAGLAEARPAKEIVHHGHPEVASLLEEEVAVLLEGPRQMEVDPPARPGEGPGPGSAEIGPEEAVVLGVNLERGLADLSAQLGEDLLSLSRGDRGTGMPVGAPSRADGEVDGRHHSLRTPRRGSERGEPPTEFPTSTTRPGPASGRRRAKPIAASTWVEAASSVWR
jgi:hypothetical protein